MNVLSLCGGLEAGRIALDLLEYPEINYYSSEIDKYAIKISSKNYPDIKHLGDMRNWKSWKLPRKIDLIICGSPCQSFSAVGDLGGFDDPRGELFFIFVEILRYFKPDFWMSENVLTKKAWVDIINYHLRTEPIIINSSLVSAQNRRRNYWSNMPISQPMDRGILLKDVLLEKPSENLFHSLKARDYMSREVKGGRTHWEFRHHSDTDNEKSSAVVANFFKGVPYNVLIDRRRSNCFRYECDFQDNQQCDCRDGDGYQEGNIETSVIRKFDPVECERLQTIPDNYTEGVSNTQRYKMIGNSWTVEAIMHIFRNML
jgi:DNA (cytosine-5)-methyltransferase 3A